MDKVVEKINYYIDNNKKILIMGDYDTDGISASAILYKYLESRNVDVSVFLPNRLVDGYGLTIESIDKVKKLYNPDLIISVHCMFTKSVSRLLRKNNLNIEKQIILNMIILH